MGVAMKLTLVPVHIAPEGNAVIFTDGVTIGLTVIVIALEVAVVDVKQLAPVIVITHVTVLLLANDGVVKILDVPFCTLIPFTLKS